MKKSSLLAETTTVADAGAEEEPVQEQTNTMAEGEPSVVSLKEEEEATDDYGDESASEEETDDEEADDDDEADEDEDELEAPPVPEKLEELLDIVHKQAEADELDLSAWSAECDQLRQALMVSDAKVEELTERNRALTEEKATLEEERAVALRRVEALEEEREKSDAKVEELTERNRALTEEKATLEEERAVAILRVEALEKEREKTRAAARRSVEASSFGAEAAAAEAAAQAVRLATATVAAEAAEEANRELQAKLDEALARAAAAEEKAATDAETASLAQAEAEAEAASAEEALAREREALAAAGAELEAVQAAAAEAAAAAAEAATQQEADAAQRAEEASAALCALRAKYDETVGELDEIKGSVRVFCRLRPLKGEGAEGLVPATRPSANPETDIGGMPRAVVVAPAGATPRQYDFDGVFDAAAPSSAVFDELRPLTRKVASGCSACVLAYGQTGSGKTHTVSALHELVVAELLSQSASLQAGAVGEGGAKLAVCIAEVYLDHVRDLAPAPGALMPVNGNGLQNGEIALTWTAVADAHEAAACVAAAAEKRVTADNGLNARSSRSHLVVVYAVLGANGERRGQLALVDLAGSERLARTEATGERRDEAVAINKSLSALGDVLSALIAKNDHVPYRNCKLTSLLQPCLKRGCRVALIIAASPAAVDAAETGHALGFGVRARACALGPITATTGGGIVRAAVGGKGGAVGGGGAAAELARAQKQLVEARQSAVAHEKASSTFKAQAAAAEDAQKASAAAAKRAEARAKELEATMERRAAVAASEKAKMQKEAADLQRRLDVALRGRRAGGAAATAVPSEAVAAKERSAPPTPAAPPPQRRRRRRKRQEPTRRRRRRLPTRCCAG